MTTLPSRRTQITVVDRIFCFMGLKFQCNALFPRPSNMTSTCPGGCLCHVDRGTKFHLQTDSNQDAPRPCNGEFNALNVLRGNGQQGHVSPGLAESYPCKRSQVAMK